MEGVAVFVEERAGLADGREQLTAAEQEMLAGARFGAAREREWIAGRAAAHRALTACLGRQAAGMSVINDPSGAPRILGRDDVALSLSHDDGWVAVAVSTGPGRRAAIDLCGLARARRVAGILERLGVPSNGLHPCLTWAALECALKLQHRSVWSLLDAPATAREYDGVIDVRFARGEATINFALTSTYAIAWATQ